jgi:hypothetical protein
VSGRVLSASAIVDITTGDSVYGAAFLVASVEMGMTLATPSTALLQAWAMVAPEHRVLLELLQDAPTVVVEVLDAATATSAGVRAHAAHTAGAFDVAAAHAVEIALERDYPILTADPEPLRAIDPGVPIEELPG